MNGGGQQNASLTHLDVFLDFKIHLVFIEYVVVVVLGINVPPTAMVIRRRDLGLKSHPKDFIRYNNEILSWSIFLLFVLNDPRSTCLITVSDYLRR